MLYKTIFQWLFLIHDVPEPNFNAIVCYRFLNCLQQNVALKIVLCNITVKFPGFLLKLIASIPKLNGTHRFHDGNMFLSNQRSLLLIGQILVTIDSLDLVFKLLLPPRHVMVSLHEWTVPQFLPQQSDSTQLHDKSLQFGNKLRIVCSDGFNNSLVAAGQGITLYFAALGFTGLAALSLTVFCWRVSGGWHKKWKET